MARTKVTTNPPPPSINYRASYSWTSDRLLAETSSLTTIADWRAHLDSEPLGKSFGRVHDAYVSVRPCIAGEPVCIDNRSKRCSNALGNNSLLTASRGSYLQSSMWPPPSCISTAGPSSGPSPFSVAFSAMSPQWTFFYTSLKPKALGITCG